MKLKIGDRVKNLHGETGTVVEIGGVIFGDDQVWCRYDTDKRETWLRTKQYVLLSPRCIMEQT